MKPLKKLLAAALIILCIAGICAVPAFAAQAATAEDSSDPGRLIRYFPTTVTVSAKETVVEGYLVNLNEDVTVRDFKNVSMTFWMNGKDVLTTEVCDLDVTVAPLSASYLRITFFGYYGLKSGTYDCDQNMYATLDADFTTENKTMQ